MTQKVKSDKTDYQEWVWDQFVYSLAIAFGSIFRKALQFTCTRTELFPNPKSIVRTICHEIESMRDDQVQSILTNAYDLHEINQDKDFPFETFDRTPIGSGCFAQVHKATLSVKTIVNLYQSQQRTLGFLDGYTIAKRRQLEKWFNNKQPIEVAVKIQRPFGKQRIEFDFIILEWLVYLYINLIHWKQSCMLMLNLCVQTVKLWILFLIEYAFELFNRDYFQVNDNDNNYQMYFNEITEIWQKRIVWRTEKDLIDKRTFELDHLVFARLGQWKRDFLVQMNCEVELQNISNFDKSYFNMSDKIQVPRAFLSISRPAHGIIVMEFLRGTPISKIDNNSDNNSDNQNDIQNNKLQAKMYNTLLELAVQSVLLKTIYHGDLHAGNLFVISETEKLGIVDFGLVHEKSPTMVQRLNKVFKEMSEDHWIDGTVAIYDLLVSEIDRKRIFSLEQLFEIILQLYYLVTIYGYDHKLSTGQVLQEAFRVLDQQGIRSHDDLSSLDISALTLESTLQALQPNAQLGDGIFDIVRSNQSNQSNHCFPTLTDDSFNYQQRAKLNQIAKNFDEKQLNLVDQSESTIQTKSQTVNPLLGQLLEWKSKDESKGEHSIIHRLKTYKPPVSKLIIPDSLISSSAVRPPFPWENQALINIFIAANNYQENQSHI